MEKMTVQLVAAIPGTLFAISLEVHPTNNADPQVYKFTST